MAAMDAVQTSSTFDFPPTTSFIDLVYRKFQELAMLLSGQVRLPYFHFVIFMNFGEGMSSSSTMSAEPLAPPADDAQQSAGHASVSCNMGTFICWVQDRFQQLLRVMLHHQLISHGRRVSLCVELACGYVSTIKSTVALTVEAPRFSLAVPHQINLVGGFGGASLEVASGGTHFQPIPRGMSWATFWSLNGNGDDSSSNGSSMNSEPEENGEDGSMIEYHQVPTQQAINDFFRSSTR